MAGIKNGFACPNSRLPQTHPLQFYSYSNHNSGKLFISISKSLILITQSPLLPSGLGLPISIYYQPQRQKELQRIVYLAYSVVKPTSQITVSRLSYGRLVLLPTQQNYTVAAGLKFPHHRRDARRNESMCRPTPEYVVVDGWRWTPLPCVSSAPYQPSSFILGGAQLLLGGRRQQFQAICIKFPSHVNQLLQGNCLEVNYSTEQRIRLGLSVVGRNSCSRI